MPAAWSSSVAGLAAEALLWMGRGCMSDGIAAPALCKEAIVFVGRCVGRPRPQRVVALPPPPACSVACFYPDLPHGDSTAPAIHPSICSSFAAPHGCDPCFPAARPTYRLCNPSSVSRSKLGHPITREGHPHATGYLAPRVPPRRTCNIRPQPARRAGKENRSFDPNPRGSHPMPESVCAVCYHVSCFISSSAPSCLSPSLLCGQAPGQRPESRPSPS